MNTLKEGAVIEIGGKKRTIKLNTRAVVRFEEKAQKSLLDFIFMEQQPKVTDIAILLWAGLLHEEKDLTLDATFDLLDEYEGGALQMLGELAKIAGGQMPQADEPEGEETDPFPGQEVKNP